MLQLWYQKPATYWEEALPLVEAELEALCAKLHGAFCARAVGSEDSVLFESTRRGGMMFGFTGNYRRVKAPYDKARVNTVCRVRLGAMDESHDLMGEIRD